VNIGSETSLPEVARIVCTALDSVGVKAVLTGGSAATFYAPDAYQSADIDFVAVFFEARRPGDADRKLRALGYSRERDHYRHLSSPYPIEFPPGPLAVGGQLVRVWRTDKKDNAVLYVLSPTDCCKDRLAAFFHWNDRSGLAQAVAVARAVGTDIDYEELAAWSEREGSVDRYAEFSRRAGQAQ
jgi:hypothetical protein